MRPKTLPAAVVPVMLASSLAYADGAFDWRAAAICLAFALLIQIGTNFANDYLDGIKGTDTEARLGPRRAVAAGLIAPRTMRRATILVLATAISKCLIIGASLPIDCSVFVSFRVAALLVECNA